jgi:hypothetical protein
MNEIAARSLDSWQTYLGPTKGFTEQVYLLEPLGDGNSSAMALLVNQDADLGTSVRWNVSELPYLTIWKNTASEEDGYVTGIEPCHLDIHLIAGSSENMVGFLNWQPEKVRSFTLDFGIHIGNDQGGRTDQ